MIHNKSFSSYKSVISVFAGILFCTTCLVSTASTEQRRFRTVEVVPAGTTIDVRTTEAIDARSSDGRVFHGVVDQDVIGNDGSIVVPQGADAELIVRRLWGHEIVLDLDSVIVDGEHYGIDASESRCWFRSGKKYWRE
jgi:hypothetical protein